MPWFLMEEAGMSGTAMKKVHLPLPPDVYARLKRESEASGIPTTVLAREAVTEWLERLERERIAEELRTFALEHAGSELDLDDGFEGAATDALAQASG
jgi:predicted DNA-binding protein